MSKVTPFLMFNDQLEAAMNFYTTTFPGSEIRSVARFSEGFSLYVDCADQAEVDT